MAHLQRNFLAISNLIFYSVSLAIDNRTKEEVVVKEIKSNFPLSRINKEIKRETDALKKLRHPNIIKYIESNQLDLEETHELSEEEPTLRKNAGIVL